MKAVLLTFWTLVPFALQPVTADCRLDKRRLLSNYYLLHGSEKPTLHADSGKERCFGQTGPKVGSFDAGYGSTHMARLPVRWRRVRSGSFRGSTMPRRYCPLTCAKALAGHNSVYCFKVFCGALECWIHTLACARPVYSPQVTGAGDNVCPPGYDLPKSILTLMHTEGGRNIKSNMKPLSNRWDHTNFHCPGVSCVCR